MTTNWPARLARAKRRYTDARQNLRDVAAEAVAAGQSEAGVARALGVDRMTIRAWLGKR